MSYNRAVVTLCLRVPRTIVATFMVASANLFYFTTEANKKPVGSLLLQLSSPPVAYDIVANLIAYESVNLPCVQAAAPASQGASMPQEVAPV